MTWEIRCGDALALLRAIPDESVDAVVTDPPYPEVIRDYGTLSVAEWETLMHGCVREVRRVLRPEGSAVFVLQPNSERVGRMRPWLWDFMGWAAREWNQIQDVWWWNYTSPPTVHCHAKHGLMKPSLKACVWLGPPDAYRDQSAVLWSPSDSMRAIGFEDRALRRHPSGQTVRPGRIAETVSARGGCTPFNVLPMANANSNDSSGSSGHGAGTPDALCEWWVRYISRPGGMVLDPFSGAGTVGVVALRHGRRFLGLELNPEYVAMARRRIAGPLFAEVTA